MLHSPPHLLSSTALLLHPVSLLPNFHSRRASTKPYSLSQRFSTRPLSPLLAQVSDSALPEDGPVELSFSTPSFISTDDDPSTLQVATSVLLTGAITIFLFRSLRRRAKRAKELELKKTLKEEALESLKAMTPVEENAPPSPLQALLGGLSAGVIALILYKFTTTIEASLNRQTISDNMSVRQITITIRTIINGICYLATFVFGINAVGLILYSGQLGLNAIMGDSPSEKTSSKEETQPNSNDSEINYNEDQDSNSTQ